jgi:hypothetical protein
MECELSDDDESLLEDSNLDEVAELFIPDIVESEEQEEFINKEENSELVNLKSLKQISLNVSLDTEYTDTQSLSIQFMVEGKVGSLDILFSV